MEKTGVDGRQAEKLMERNLISADKLAVEKDKLVVKKERMKLVPRGYNVTHCFFLNLDFCRLKIFWDRRTKEGTANEEVAIGLVSLSTDPMSYMSLCRNFHVRDSTSYFFLFHYAPN